MIGQPAGLTWRVAPFLGAFIRKYRGKSLEQSIDIHPVPVSVFSRKMLHSFFCQSARGSSGEKPNASLLPTLRSRSASQICFMFRKRRQTYCSSHFCAWCRKWMDRRSIYAMKSCTTTTDANRTVMATLAFSYPTIHYCGVLRKVLMHQSAQFVDYSTTSLNYFA